jgi:hypothetical protein
MKQAGAKMYKDATNPIQCAAGKLKHSDQQSILDLIKQLDLDLIETQKNASKSERFLVQACTNNS